MKYAMQRAFSFLFIGCLVFALFSIFVIPAKASTPNLSITSSATIGTAWPPDNGGTAIRAGRNDVCFINGNWFAVFLGSSTVSPTATVSYSYSSDGLTWSAKATLVTTANAMFSTNAWAFACSGTTIEIAYFSVNTNTVPFRLEVSVATPASPTTILADVALKSASGGAMTAWTVQRVNEGVDAAGNFMILTTNQGNATMDWFTGGLFVAHIFPQSSALSSIPQIIPGTGSVAFYLTSDTSNSVGNNIYYFYTGAVHAGATNRLMWGSTLVNGIGGACASGHICIVSAANNVGTAACTLESIDSTSGVVTESTPNALTGCATAGAPNENEAVSDGGSNIWVIWTTTSAKTVWASSDGGSSYTGNVVFAVPTGTSLLQVSGIVKVNGQLQAVGMALDGSNNAYMVTFSLGSQSVNPTTQQQTVGSCPPGGGTGVGHWTLANNTQYWYEGNALGSEVVNTIQTEVSSVVGSGSHSLQLLIYITAPVNAAQVPSINYPAVLAYSKSFLISSGTVNSTITLQVSIPLNVVNLGQLPFNFWAVGIVGDDHIKIAGSSLSGLMTQTGTASTAAQPLTFTSAGSTISNKLALCATGQYQSVISNTITTTAAASTTTTASTTITSTISTIGPALFSTASNWPTIFLILLLPAGLFLGVTRSLAGAILGLVVGAVIGQMMGILPPFVFIGLVISLVAIAFVARERSQ